MTRRMRTTVRLDDRVFRDAKAHAAKVGRTLGDVFADALRAYLGGLGRVRRRRRVRLPTVTGNGLQPGVNLDSNAELLDFMDGIPAAR